MNEKNMRSYLVSLVLLVCLLASCGPGGGPPPSAAAYFNKTQGNTMTPNGMVKAGSAEPAGDGKVRYQTEDGKKWEVTATPDGKGGYRYSSPKAVK